LLKTKKAKARRLTQDKEEKAKEDSFWKLRRKN